MWHTAIGLQAVDGLKPSQYLIDTAIKNIEGDQNELHNRYMYVSGMFGKNIKADIENVKADIQRELKDGAVEVSHKTISHVLVLLDNCGRETVFGRSDVEKMIGLKSTRASELIKLLLESHMIEPVKGCGKGKYRFVAVYVRE